MVKYEDFVIEVLANSEAALRDHLAAALAERDQLAMLAQQQADRAASLRLVMVQALNLARAMMLERDRVEERYHRLIEEYRRFRATGMGASLSGERPRRLSAHAGERRGDQADVGRHPLHRTRGPDGGRVARDAR
jgi:hypothetical protein